MTRKSKYALLPFVVLMLSIIVFEVSDIDYSIQRLFYDNETQQWIIGRDNTVLRFIFYDGIKLVLLTFVAILFLVPIVFRRHPVVVELRPRLILSLLSIALTLATASGLKAVTNVACPAQLTLFGGSIPHISLFSTYPDGQRPVNQQRCFPAGHASGGFAVLSLVLLFKSRRNQHRVIMVGLLLGWVMGLYKMLVGDHFLSHTITSMLLAWCSIGVVSLLASHRHENKTT